jgi:hypothetical protein
VTEFIIYLLIDRQDGITVKDQKNRRKTGGKPEKENLAPVSEKNYFRFDGRPGFGGKESINAAKLGSALEYVSIK